LDVDSAPASAFLIPKSFKIIPLQLGCRVPARVLACLLSDGPVAINATQLIAIEVTTVRQRVNADTAVHAHNIFLRHLGTFIANTMVWCKLVFLNVVL
jgi:hypothetical protein